MIGAGNRDEAVLTWENLDLAVTNMAGEIGNAGEFQSATEQRVCRIRDGDLPVAFLSDQRGITLGGVFLSQDCR